MGTTSNAGVCLLAILLSFGLPTSATSQEQNSAACEDTNAAPDHTISACTALIRAGGLAPQALYFAYNNRGAGYARVRDFPHAMLDLNEAIRLNPNAAMAYYNRGNTYNDRQDYTHAIADYSEAIRLDPRNSSAYVNRGNAYQSNRDYEHAVADYSQAVQLDPNNPDAYFDRGAVYFRLREFSQGLADFDRAATLRPHDAAIEGSRCWGRAVANQDLATARSACDRSLQIQPSDPATLDSRGLVGLRQERWQDAWNDYNSAVAIDASNARHLYGRGIAALRLGNAFDAQTDIARATSIDPNIANTYAAFGQTP